MNCENYRNAIAAAPSWEGGAEHLAECAACRSYRDEMRALDRRIAGALELDVPALKMPELEDTSVVAFKPRRVSTPAWFALAATVVIAAFLGIRAFEGDVSYPTLADEIVAHLDHEPYALRVTDEAVSDRRLARVVPANIANMNHDTGLITYAQTCVINGKEVPHLVIQGKSGPVTVLLMPDEMVDGAQQIKGESINGVILPVGSGSIAIIGEEDERLDTIQESVMHSVSWST
jgi:hypothetical protein